MSLHFYDLLSIRLVGSLVIGYLILLAVWRLWFSSLANFPGPKLAAITGLYEAYFDVYRDGQFYKEMERLHGVYGPIIRISPRELHVKDPDWVDELYTVGNRRRDKDPWHTAEGTQATSSSTVSHDLHRARRAAIASCFSKASMKTLEPVLQASVKEVTSNFERYAKSGETVVLGTIFAKLTIDLVLQMWFGCEMGEVERWQCLPNANEPIPPPLSFSHRMRHFPWSFMHLLVLPTSVVRKMPIGLILDLQKNSASTAKEALGRPRGSTWVERQLGWKLVIHVLQDSPLAKEQRSNDRISDEAFSFVMASLESTAQTLSVCLYHLLRNPATLERLREELDNAPPDDQGNMALATLEKLRYLRAVLDETLRINASVSGRLPRIAPDEELTYGDYAIPRGTPVSMDHHFTHLNEDYFDQAYQFNPERWLDPETSKASYKYLRPFGKGSRMCVGKYVAECEMLIAIATLVRGFEMELVDTSDKDVFIERDYLAGAAHWEATGVKVKILGAR